MSEEFVYPKLYKKAKDVCLPEYKTIEAACFDVSCYLKAGTEINYFTEGRKTSFTIDESESIILEKGRYMIPTGLHFDIPVGYSLRLHPRSGLSIKHGINLVNQEAVIDSDFVDEVMILLQIEDSNGFLLKNKERVAQGEFVKDIRTKFIMIDSIPSKKGNRTGGFGSTGTN